MNRSEETKTYIRPQKPFLFFLWQFCKFNYRVSVQPTPKFKQSHSYHFNMLR